jgi:hypothetical protein
MWFKGSYIAQRCPRTSYDSRVIKHYFKQHKEGIDCVWNVMAQSQKPDFVFRRNGRVHLNQQGRQFSRLLATKVCASEVVLLDTPCSEVLWRVLATHSIRHFPLYLPSRASPCAITFYVDSSKFPGPPLALQHVSASPSTVSACGIFS